MNYAQKTDGKELFTMIQGGKGHTIKDIEALPDGERAELIDGEIFKMDAPSLAHQELLIELAFEIKAYIKKSKGNCRVIPAPFGVYIKKDNRNYVEPDISVICDREKLDQRGCHGAPDWAVEIVSSSSAKMDYERKTILYREAGMQEYWIVDPEKETVTVYDFAGDGDAVQYTFSDRIKVGIFEGLYLNFSEMDVIFP